MARAKRTARADARRRHRAQLAAEGIDTGEPFDSDGGAGPAPAPRPGARPAPGRPGLASGPARPAPAGGMASAFRLAFRPPNVREDLALLPKLIRHRAFWLPVLISAAVAAVIIAFQGREQISALLGQYFLGVAPMGSVFLAGFLAPRASYLIGLLVGFVVAVFTVIAGLAVGGSANTVAVVEILTLAPLNGLFFAAAAAWYRRFLYLASPARRMPPPRSTPEASRGKPARGR